MTAELVAVMATAAKVQGSQSESWCPNGFVMAKAAAAAQQRLLPSRRVDDGSWPVVDEANVVVANCDFGCDKRTSVAGYNKPPQEKTLSVDNYCHPRTKHR